MSLRKGINWYRKLAIKFILETAVVNAWILYRKASQKKKKNRNFKEELPGSLLKLCINNSEQQRSRYAKLSATHHLLKRVNSTGKLFRRYCSSCCKKVKE